jgi:hypothetical protein
VKHRGKALQEFGEVVYLPFGSEYSLLIKNLNTVRAIVKVKIDGAEVTQGVNLVVQPGSSIELERFIKNGNLNAGNRFKFLQRTAAVAQHRGVNLEDGLIQVTWNFEQKPQPYVGPAVAHGAIFHGGNVVGSLNAGNTVGSLYHRTADMPTTPTSTVTTSTPTAPKGITGPGSVSHQQFAPVGWFPTEAVSHSLVLQLAGEAHSVGTVSAAVYTRTKVDCTVCGSKAKTSAKFCSDCGASLNIIG